VIGDSHENLLSHYGTDKQTLKQCWWWFDLLTSKALFSIFFLKLLIRFYSCNFVQVLGSLFTFLNWKSLCTRSTLCFSEERGCSSNGEETVFCTLWRPSHSQGGADYEKHRHGLQWHGTWLQACYHLVYLPGFTQYLYHLLFPNYRLSCWH